MDLTTAFTTAMSRLPDKVDQGRVEWLQLNSESLTAPSYGLL